MCALGKSSYFASRILSQEGFNATSLIGGLSVRAPPALPKEETKINDQSKNSTAQPSKEHSNVTPVSAPREVTLDMCGMSCPGPIMELRKALDSGKVAPGDVVTVRASDAGFQSDIKVRVN